MKKILALVLALIMAMSLAACGSKGDSGEPKTDNQTENSADSGTKAPDKTEAQPPQKESIMTFEGSKGKIEVNNCEVFTNNFGNKAIRFYCTATNKSDEPMTAFRNPTTPSIAWTEGTQGGKNNELHWSDTIDIDKTYVNHETIEPGESAECVLLLKLVDTETDLELMLMEFGKPETKVTHTFKMADIPVVE